MKMITAIIKPFKLDDVKEALHEVGVQGMTNGEIDRLLFRAYYNPTDAFKGKPEFAAMAAGINAAQNALQVFVDGVLEGTAVGAVGTKSTPSFISCAGVGCAASSCATTSWRPTTARTSSSASRRSRSRPGPST